MGLWGERAADRSRPTHKERAGASSQAPGEVQIGEFRLEGVSQDQPFLFALDLENLSCPVAEEMGRWAGRYWQI